MNDKYEKILQLERKLAAAEIPRIFQKIYDGYQIIYIDQKGNKKGDVVEHQMSYGLEAMGFDLETDVEGWLTVDEAFDLFKNVHEKEKKKWKS